MADILLNLFELTALLMLNEQQFYLFGQIQTCQTGSQPYSDTSPYFECFLAVFKLTVAMLPLTLFITSAPRCDCHFPCKKAQQIWPSRFGNETKLYISIAISVTRKNCQMSIKVSQKLFH